MANVGFWESFLSGGRKGMDWYEAEQQSKSSSSAAPQESSSGSYEDPDSSGGLFGWLFGAGSENMTQSSSSASDKDGYPYCQDVNGIKVYAENQRGLRQGVRTVEGLAKDPDTAEHLNKIRYLYMEDNAVNQSGQRVAGRSFGGGDVSLQTGMNQGYTHKVVKHELGHKLGMGEREADEFAGLPHNPSDWDGRDYS